MNGRRRMGVARGRAMVLAVAGTAAKCPDAEVPPLPADFTGRRGSQGCMAASFSRRACPPWNVPQNAAWEHGRQARRLNTVLLRTDPLPQLVDSIHVATTLPINPAR